MKSPPLGLLTQIFSELILSPRVMSRVATTEANANAIVAPSPAIGVFSPPRAENMIFEPSIKDFKELGSIELEISGPGRSMLSVKCRSKIEAPSATAPKHV